MNLFCFCCRRGFAIYFLKGAETKVPPGTEVATNFWLTEQRKEQVREDGGWIPRFHLKWHKVWNKWIKWKKQEDQRRHNIICYVWNGHNIRPTVKMYNIPAVTKIVLKYIVPGREKYKSWWMKCKKRSRFNLMELTFVLRFLDFLPTFISFRPKGM